MAQTVASEEMGTVGTQGRDIGAGEHRHRRSSLWQPALLTVEYTIIG